MTAIALSYVRNTADYPGCISGSPCAPGGAADYKKQCRYGQSIILLFSRRFGRFSSSLVRMVKQGILEVGGFILELWHGLNDRLRGSQGWSTHDG